MAVAINKSLMDIHPRELKGMILDIPTLPVIYQELFTKMQDEQVAVPEIAEIITQDQALTTKILHLVNSAFYGYATQIKTISRAVVILGFQAVRSAALAISVFDYFRDEDSSEQVDMSRFWEHSVAVAAICKVVAREVAVGQQDEAFVAGLLHDVGKLIEKRYFAADFDEVCNVAGEQHLSWYDCECALFQVNHATIGKAIFRNWNFPTSVVESVQFHHKPESARKHPQLTALVHVADYLAYELGHGAPGAHPPTECSAAALDLLKTDLRELETLHGTIQEEIQQSMEIIKLVE